MLGVMEGVAVVKRWGTRGLGQLIGRKLLGFGLKLEDEVMAGRLGMIGRWSVGWEVEY